MPTVFQGIPKSLTSLSLSLASSCLHSWCMGREGFSPVEKAFRQFTAPPGLWCFSDLCHLCGKPVKEVCGHWLSTGTLQPLESWRMWQDMRGYWRMTWRMWVWWPDARVFWTVGEYRSGGLNTLSSHSWECLEQLVRSHLLVPVRGQLQGCSIVSIA